jgi:FkbM family methyltransferase
MRVLLRRLLDSRLPNLARVYRLLREERLRDRPSVLSPLGFSLAGNDAMERGEFEREELAIFSELLARSSVCVDVGANVGLYTCLAARYAKHVLAMEPLAGNLSLLYKNLWSNGFLEVEVYPVGLSSKPGLRALYGGGTGASFVPGWAQAPESWKTIVPVSTLDVILGDRFTGVQLVIKLDVEGFELEVLKGAARTLTRTPRPFWLVEICLSDHQPTGLNRHFVETFEIFWRCGYEAAAAVPGRRIIKPDDVNRWLRKGRVDFGSHNYVFAAASHRNPACSRA